jgi:hypothetical protein
MSIVTTHSPGGGRQTHIDSALAVASVGMLGTRNIVVLNADTSDPSGAAEIFSNATGFNQVTFYPAASLASGTPIVIGFSTDDSDSASCIAAINSVLSKLTTQDGTMHPNVVVLTADNPVQQVSLLDGTTIKTICAETTSAAKVYIVDGTTTG